jgi:hypothetical protein
VMDEAIPYESRAETADDHLTAAENWLVLAENERTALSKLDDIEPTSRLQWAAARVDTAATLAELHRKMAETYWGYPRELTSTITADQAMADMHERLKADAAAHDAVRLTAEDPEPESTTGDLWIDDKEPNARLAFLYRISPEWWRWAPDHAYILRVAGDEDGNSWSDALDGGYVVRRPTQEERERFYGPPQKLDDTPSPAWLTYPVPDDQGGQIDASVTQTTCDCCASGLFTASGTHAEICGDCGHGGGLHNGNAPIPVRHVQAETMDLHAFTDRSGTSLAELNSDQLDALIRTALDDRQRRRRG